MMDEWKDAEQLIAYGSTVKALGDGRIQGYLVRFTSPDELDLEGDYFDAQTDFDFKNGERTAVYYHHGGDKTLGKRKLCDGVLTLKDAGVWLDAQLEMRDGYERAIYHMAEEERLGSSSGTAPHLVEREPIEDGKGYHITRWPLRLDASLTPTPADPGNRVLTLKSYMAQHGNVKALEPEDVSEGTSAPVDTPDANKPATKSTHGGATMGIKAFLIGGQWYAYKTDESGARVGDPLKAGTKEEIDGYLSDLQTPDQVKIAKALATSMTETIQPLTKSVADLASMVNAMGAAEAPHYNTETKAWATLKSDPEFLFGDFLVAVKNKDAALLERIYKEGDDQKALKVLGEQTMAAGGALVPQQFRAELIRFDPEAEIIYPRARVVPTTGPVALPTLSTVGSTAGQTNVFGGVHPSAVRSGETKPTSEPSFGDIELDPKEMAVYASVKDQLLRRSAISVSEVLTGLFRDSLAFYRDEWFLDGNGATQAQGIINSNGTYVQARAAAGTIGYLDLVRMKQHLYLPSWTRAFWVFQISTYETLETMANPTSGDYIWQQNAVDGAPRTVLGLPYYFTEKTPVLGTQGDVLLVDPRYYYIAEEQGVMVATSTDFLFSQNRTAFKAWLTVDGQEMLTAPIFYKDGVTEFSPFVMLGDAATG